MIYFVRHGESEANARRHADPFGTYDKNDADSPLSAKGREQTQATAEELKSINFDVIISSPLSRAYETAEIINQYHNLPIVVTDDLRERENQHGLDKQELRDSFNFNWANPKNSKIEPVKELFSRVYRAMDEIKEKFGHQNILLVAHAGMSWAVDAYFRNREWAGDILFGETIKNAEVRIYDFKARGINLWTPEKVHIATEKSAPIFSEREIWWCEIGENIGIEMNGKGERFQRPVLVFRKFGQKFFLGIPLTSQAKTGNYYLEINPVGNAEQSILSLTQIKALGAERLVRPIGKIGESEYNATKQAVGELLHIISPKADLRASSPCTPEAVGKTNSIIPNHHPKVKSNPKSSQNNTRKEQK
ncbi:MAG: histidine phosphatase family protein [Candidatus Nomurabacteria bacterium]|jgi:uncharacterized phosphatase|nr:histidine phosphatase family protein [Candidatus Nomurabacteria bacterium]